MEAGSLKLTNKQRLLICGLIATTLTGALLKVFASEVQLLAYFSNYLLACACLGTAVGCLNAKISSLRIAKGHWLDCLALILLLLLLSHFSPIRDLGGVHDLSTFFYYAKTLPSVNAQEITATGVLILAFYLTARCFMPLGQEIGELVQKVPPAAATACLAFGMLVAVCLMAAATHWLIPPVVLVTLLCLGALASRRIDMRWYCLSTACVISSLFFNTFVLPDHLEKARDYQKQYYKNFWAPYYHVQTYPLLKENRLLAIVITANHRPFRYILRQGLSKDEVSWLKGQTADLYGLTNYHLSMPYFVQPHPKQVLILGAAAGDCVAEALAHGAQHVDAVEGERWLLRLGKLNPDQPYRSSRVTRILMDPREFLKQPGKRYDLIVFADMSSHTSQSPLGQLRTDDFDYTPECFADARDHLASKGVLAVSYIPERAWHMLRLAANIVTVFNTIDTAFYTDFGGWLITGVERVGKPSITYLEKIDPLSAISEPTLISQISNLPPSNDDYPFNFASGPSIPRSYFYCTILVILLLLFFCRPFARGENGETRLPHRCDWQLAILCAALLTLETKFSMTTAFNCGAGWKAALIGAIGIACANIGAALCAHRRTPGWLPWCGLLLCLAADYSFNYEALVSIGNPVVRILLISLPAWPVFFLSWIVLNQVTGHRNAAIAYSMCFAGIASGTLLGTNTFWFGISNMDVMALLLCLAALAAGLPGFQPKRTQPTSAATSPDAVV